MANVKETATWENGIYQLETTDPVLGGENGIDNLQARQLANRTQWLKTELAQAVQSIGSLGTSKADKATQITAGNGLTGGGDLSANRTITLGTPGKITGSSTNSVGVATHTHEIDNAGPTVAGVMKVLNVLNSTDNLSALSAAQGKVLAELISGLASGKLPYVPGQGAGLDFDTAPVGVSGYRDTPYGWGSVLTVPTSGDMSQLIIGQGRAWVRYRNSGTWIATELSGTDWSAVRNRPSNIKAYASDAVNQTELATAINNLVNGAPGALDTLRELATAMGNDPNFASTIANQLAQTVKTSGSQQLSGNYTLAGGALTISGGRIMDEYHSWREVIKFANGPHGVIMSAAGYGIGLHDINKGMYWIDSVNKRVGMSYLYENQTLYVVTEVVAGGSHYLTRKADRATTLAGYGITDGLRSADLSAQVKALTNRSNPNVTIYPDGRIVQKVVMANVQHKTLIATYPSGSESGAKIPVTWPMTFPGACERVWAYFEQAPGGIIPTSESLELVAQAYAAPAPSRTGATIGTLRLFGAADEPVNLIIYAEGY